MEKPIKMLQPMMSSTLVTLLGACFLVVGFIILLKLFMLLDHARAVGRVSRHALTVMGDATLDDDTKEKAMQRNAIELFKLFVLLTLGGFAALFIPVGALWGADRIGWVSLHAVIELTVTWEFLVGATIVGVGIHMLLTRKEAAEETRFENRYSQVDRLLHLAAFASRPVFAALSNLEDKIFKKQLTTISAAPVFITALPRAGTTLLLELCHRLPEFASHTYRHMPFVLTPLLWDRFSRLFRTADVARERAHGDGMTISLDSPEAFEEMLWMAFWPNHYQRDRITLWDTAPVPEFDTFFARHGDKIALLAAMPDDLSPRRYVAKNNLNIARVARLARLIPNSRIVIPFRNPYQHTASLLRQHLNFTAIHAQDTFARTYMAGIGHFEFGANLKPVAFDDWLDKTHHKDPTQISFWLAYWEASYTHLLAQVSERVQLIDFDALCADPVTVLERLAEFLMIEDRQVFLTQAERIQPPRPHQVDKSIMDPTWRDQIDDLYTRLKETSM